MRYEEEYPELIEVFSSIAIKNGFGNRLLGIKNNYGETALIKTAKNANPRGYIKSILTLNKESASYPFTLLAMKDKKGNTALHYFHSLYISIELFLNAAGNKAAYLTFIPNNKGETPLHLAVHDCDSRKVKALLKAAGNDAKGLISMRTGWFDDQTNALHGLKTAFDYADELMYRYSDDNLISSQTSLIYALLNEYLKAPELPELLENQPEVEAEAESEPQSNQPTSTSFCIICFYHNH